MRFEKTREILDHAREFHHLIAQAYHRLGEQTDRERMRMLLSYLETHENHLEETLTEYENEAAEKVLGHWFQTSPCDAKFKELRALLEQAPLTEEDVVAMAIEVDNCLIDMYKQLARIAEDDSVCDMFKALIRLEEHEERCMVRDSMRFQDI